jgi:hypothetical protein
LNEDKPFSEKLGPAISWLGNDLADDIYPSLNKPYSTFIVIVGIGTGGFLAYTGMFKSPDLLSSLMIFAVALVAATGSIRQVYRASQLRMNEEGMSFGETRIKWREVTDVRRVAFGIHCRARDRKIIIVPYAYENPDDVIMFVVDALAKAH